MRTLRDHEVLGLLSSSLLRPLLRSWLAPLLRSAELDPCADLPAEAARAASDAAGGSTTAARAVASARWPCRWVLQGQATSPRLPAKPGKDFACPTSSPLLRPAGRARAGTETTRLLVLCRAGLLVIGARPRREGRSRMGREARRASGHCPVADGLQGPAFAHVVSSSRRRCGRHPVGELPQGTVCDRTRRCSARCVLRSEAPRPPATTATFRAESTMRCNQASRGRRWRRCSRRRSGNLRPRTHHPHFGA